MTVLVTTQAELQPPTKFAVVADGSATSRPIKLMGIDSVLSLCEPERRAERPVRCVSRAGADR